MTASERGGDETRRDEENARHQAGYDAYVRKLSSPTTPTVLSLYDVLFYAGTGYQNFFLRGVADESVHTETGEQEAWVAGMQLAHSRLQDIYGTAYRECFQLMVSQPNLNMLQEGIVYREEGAGIANPYAPTQKPENETWDAGRIRAQFDVSDFHCAGYHGHINKEVNPYAGVPHREVERAMWDAGAEKAVHDLWRIREAGYDNYITVVMENRSPFDGIYEERACLDYLEHMSTPYSVFQPCQANAWCEGVRKAQVDLAEIYREGYVAYLAGDRSNPYSGMRKAAHDAWAAGNNRGMLQGMMDEPNLLGDPRGWLPYATNNEDTDDDIKDERRPGRGGWPSKTGNPSGGGRDNA